MKSIDTADPNFQADFNNLSQQVREFCHAFKQLYDVEPVIAAHAQRLEVAMSRLQSWVDEDEDFFKNLLDESTGKKKPLRVWHL